MARAIGISGSIPPRAMSPASAAMSIAMPSTVRSRTGKPGSGKSRSCRLTPRLTSNKDSGRLVATDDASTALDRQLFPAIEIPNGIAKSGRQNNPGERENINPLARFPPDGDDEAPGHGHVLAVTDRHEDRVFARSIEVGGQRDNACRISLRRQISDC